MMRRHGFWRTMPIESFDPPSEQELLPMFGSIVVEQIVCRDHIPQKDNEIYTQQTWSSRNAQIPQ